MNCIVINLYLHIKVPIRIAIQLGVEHSVYHLHHNRSLYNNDTPTARRANNTQSTHCILST